MRVDLAPKALRDRNNWSVSGLLHRNGSTAMSGCISSGTSVALKVSSRVLPKLHHYIYVFLPSCGHTIHTIRQNLGRLEQKRPFRTPHAYAGMQLHPIRMMTRSKAVGNLACSKETHISAGPSSDV